MAFIVCPQCKAKVSENAIACPRCGNTIKSMMDKRRPLPQIWRGFEWRSSAELLGWPWIHIAFGRSKQTGKLLVAKGIIAIGQYAIGVITIAQFGIGILFGFGQFIGGFIAIAQFALGLYFGLGQFATGITAIGQIAFGRYILAQTGYGEYVWTMKIKNPVAIEHFKNLWDSIRNLF